MTLEELQAENTRLTAANAEQLTTMTGLQEQTTAMRGQMDTLLGETKAAKIAKAAADAAAAKASEDTAREKGDFESLHKSAQERYDTLNGEHTTLQASIGKEKVSGAALKLASAMADGDNVELMSTFIARRLTYKDDAVKITDIDGALTVSTLQNLQTEFEGDKRYASLLRGNGSTGGGAPGSKGGGGAAKIMARAEFENLSAVDQKIHMKAGGTLKD